MGRRVIPPAIAPFVPWLAGTVLLTSVGAMLAGRFRRSSRTAVLPRTEDEARAAGARVGLPIPEACLPGVVANLALLGRHAATLRGGA